MSSVTFFVAGEPIPKQSFRFVNNKKGFIEPRVKNWADAVAIIGQNQMQNDGSDPFKGALRVELNFLRETARRADVDNLAKNVLDAVEKVCYGNDSQIFDLRITKKYNQGAAAGVWVTISEIEMSDMRGMLTDAI